MKLFSSILFLLLFIGANTFACTVAVISGKATPDGRPLLWKQRDTESENNKLVFIKGAKYNFMGLVNAEDKDSENVWMGVNSAGFAIMNSASFNLKSKEDTATVADREGILMRQALEQCATLADFECFLTQLPKPWGVEANFGVIDAQGGAAFYETGNYNATKFDVNNPTVAPNGYIVRSNYSFTGTPNKGYGFIRFQTASEYFYEAAGEGNITPQFILDKVGRSQYNSLTHVDILSDLPQNADDEKYVFNQDCISRYSTTSSMVIKGINKGEKVKDIDIYTVLGNPLSSPIIPMSMPDKASDLPPFLTAEDDKTAFLCDKSLAIKHQFSPITRGSGDVYMNLAKVANQEGTGCLQNVRKLDKQIELLWKNHRFNGLNKSTYDLQLNKMIKSFYSVVE
ncbi:hypothetical protein EMN47_02540 [Prolixibacteraceae bacterium JC049]|nr:hypothetical protein [Prolixibacteraceae bacterium JC049]